MRSLIIHALLALSFAIAMVSAQQTPTGVIAITVSTPNQAAFAPQCLNGQWTLDGQNLNLLVSVNVFNGPVVTNMPMAENSLDTVTGTFAEVTSTWFLNAAPATVVLATSFNIKTQTTTGNTWTFALGDNVPVVGGNIQLGACATGAAVPLVTVAFSSNKFIQTAGNMATGGNIPAVSALPIIISGVNPANMAVVTTTTTRAPTTTTTTVAASSSSSASASAVPSSSAAAPASSSAGNNVVGGGGNNAAVPVGNTGTVMPPLMSDTNLVAGIIGTAVVAIVVVGGSIFIITQRRRMGKVNLSTRV